MKQILAIHTNGHTIINPQACPHARTVIIQVGHQYTIQGEATDDIECFEQCLDCGWVMRGDRTWGPHHQEIKTSEIPY